MLYFVQRCRSNACCATRTRLIWPGPRPVSPEVSGGFSSGRTSDHIVWFFRSPVRSSLIFSCLWVLDVFFWRWCVCCYFQFLTYLSYRDSSNAAVRILIFCSFYPGLQKQCYYPLLSLFAPPLFPHSLTRKHSNIDEVQQTPHKSDRICVIMWT